MPTRKVDDTPKQEKCRHPSHNPPSHRVYEEGIYEHTCPNCGKKQRFRVDKPKLSNGGNDFMQKVIEQRGKNSQL